jgi:hypothetical protein
VSDVTNYDDERLFVELRDAVRAAAQVPPRFIEAGKAAFVWRTVDAELAELSYDSATSGAIPGIRADQATLRALTYVARQFTIEVEVASEALLGQVVPPRAGEVEVYDRNGCCHTAPIDEVGWFVVRPVPLEMFRLHVHTANGESVVTQWTTL